MHFRDKITVTRIGGCMSVRVSPWESGFWCCCSILQLPLQCAASWHLMLDRSNMSGFHSTATCLLRMRYGAAIAPAIPFWSGIPGFLDAQSNSRSEGDSSRSAQATHLHRTHSLTTPHKCTPIYFCTFTIAQTPKINSQGKLCTTPAAPKWLLHPAL